MEDSYFHYVLGEEYENTYNNNSNDNNKMTKDIQKVETHKIKIRNLQLEAASQCPSTVLDIKTPSSQVLCVALQKEPKLLKLIGKRFRRTHACLTAVKVDGLMLEYVPLGVKSRISIELAAVQQNKRAIDFVRPEAKELCALSIKNKAEISGKVKKFLASLVSPIYCLKKLTATDINTGN